MLEKGFTDIRLRSRFSLWLEVGLIQSGFFWSLPRGPSAARPISNAI